MGTVLKCCLFLGLFMCFNTVAVEVSVSLCFFLVHIISFLIFAVNKDGHVRELIKLVTKKIHHYVH